MIKIILFISIILNISHSKDIYTINDIYVRGCSNFLKGEVNNDSTIATLYYIKGLNDGYFIALSKDFKKLKIPDTKEICYIYLKTGKTLNIATLYALAIKNNLPKDRIIEIIRMSKLSWNMLQEEKKYKEKKEKFTFK